MDTRYNSVCRSVSKRQQRKFCIWHGAVVKSTKFYCYYRDKMGGTEHKITGNVNKNKKFICTMCYYRWVCYNKNLSRLKEENKTILLEEVRELQVNKPITTKKNSEDLQQGKPRKKNSEDSTFNAQTNYQQTISRGNAAERQERKFSKLLLKIPKQFQNKKQSNNPQENSIKKKSVDSTLNSLRVPKKKIKRSMMKKTLGKELPTP
ncbi:hypothetical protein M0813_12183 [Anaeramoeba flamelloides]|uniref:Uncharacterized protein n=1 Tax=Anaeramoeba flamelloides TaxID=1746091 RepID=A0ABQ8ZCI9_9EUKA|nr:hypothetical protein M0813_12183 [Anaeramoeba flamelloides]